MSKLQYNTFTIVTVGSIQHIKGTDLCTDVALEVCKKNENVQFVCCGGALDKKLFEECLKKVKNNELEDRILFLGHIDDAKSIIAAAHLYFSSSRLDSMLLAVLEAMSFGKNIGYYDSGGIKEAVGGFGFLIPKFDVQKTKYAILEKPKLFENNPKSIFNEKSIQ